MIQVEVRHYGVFRKYLKDGTSSTKLFLDKPRNLLEFKSYFTNYLKSEISGFSDETLVSESAIADEVSILPDDHMIDSNCQLSILPPVCGG